jgi:hypothetical protein
MKLRIPIGYQVECLYTRGTCVAHDTTVRLDDSSAEFAELLTTYFSDDIRIREILPVTLVLTKGDASPSLYYTYIDNTLSVGRSCRYPTGLLRADRWKIWPSQLAESPIADTTNPRGTEYKPYKIYHMVDPDWQLPIKEQQPRELAGIVFTTSLQLAYEASQNPMSTWTHTGKRSTSVGDIIEEDRTCYMVAGMGFKLLPDVKFTETGEQVSEADLEQYEKAIIADLSKERIHNED